MPTITYTYIYQFEQREVFSSAKLDDDDIEFYSSVLGELKSYRTEKNL